MELGAPIFCQGHDAPAREKINCSESGVNNGDSGDNRKLVLNLVVDERREMSESRVTEEKNR